MANLIESMREDLIAAGYSKQQANSAVVLGVMDIMADTGSSYYNLQMLNDQLLEAVQRKDRADKAASAAEAKCLYLQKKLQDAEAFKKDLQKEVWKNGIDRIDQFLEELHSFETPEARDDYRKLQIFLRGATDDGKLERAIINYALAMFLFSASKEMSEKITVLEAIVADQLRSELEWKEQYGDFF